MPSSNGCANGASGWADASPCSASGSVFRNGEASASETTVAQTSWTEPGRVNSAERSPPPMVGCASYTRTDRPARASVIAAASPFGPDPMTRASVTD